MKGWIALEGLEFFAYHGVHPAEQEIGNRFTVDLEVEAEMEAAVQHDTLSGTVDYGLLYQVVAETMKQPAKLLEALAGIIIQRVMNEFPTVSAVKVSVAKANPPVGGLARQSKVTLSQTRNSL